MFVSILLLSLLGSSSAGFFRGAHFHGFIAPSVASSFSDNAQATVEKFLARMVQSIESKDVSIISGLFQPDFIFKGCRGTYDKTKIVGLLSSLPAGTKFTITLNSVEDEGSSIKYVVSASGFGQAEVVAEFVLNKQDQQLESGSVPACQKSLRRSLVAQDDDQKAFNAMRLFLTYMKSQLGSKGSLGMLLDDQFNLKGCHGTYNKDQTLALIDKLSGGSSSSMDFTLRSSQYKEYTPEVRPIIGNAIISSPNGEFDTRLLFNPTSHSLLSATIIACPPARHFAIAQDTAQGTIEKFLTRMIKTVETHEKSLILELFEPDFSFKGCKATYNREQAVALLMFIPRGTQFSYQIKSVDDHGKSINCVLLASGMAEDDVEFDFVLNKKDQQLESAVMPVCPLRRRFANSDDGSSVFHGLVGQKPRHFAIAQDTAQATIEKFLTQMIKTVETHEKSLILELFEPDFSFKGCKATYNREQAVALLMFIPRGTQFSYQIKSVEDNGNSINCVLLATGMAKDDVEFDFVLNKKDQQLESAVMPVCPLRKNFASDAPESSDAVVQRFLAHLEQVIASHDQTAIENLFDDNFLFKSCRTTYNKAQVARIIISSFPNASMEFKLKFSNWNNAGQIEYTVTISGPGNGFDAQFVYCPQRNVLKSGSISTCQAVGRRFIDFWDLWG